MKTGSNTSERTASSSYEVVKVLSEKTGTPLVELPPLYESVDPDALDALFTPDYREPLRGETTFSYADHEVTISSDGELVISATPE